MEFISLRIGGGCTAQLSHFSGDRQSISRENLLALSYTMS